MGFGTARTIIILILILWTFPSVCGLSDDGALEVRIDLLDEPYVDGEFTLNAVIIDPLPDSTYSYSWDFDDTTDLDGDGVLDNDREGDGPQVYPLYDRPGLFNITVLVTDGKAHAKDVLQVTVRARGVTLFAPEKERYERGEPVNVTWRVERGQNFALAVLWGGTLDLMVFDETNKLVHEETLRWSLPGGTSIDVLTFSFHLPKAGEYRIEAIMDEDYSHLLPNNTTYVTVYDDKGDASIEPVDGDDSVPFLPVLSIVVLASLAVALSVETTKVSVLGLGLPLYTKLRKERVMDDFTRGRILGYITANPGEHYNAVRRALDLANGTLTHHLRVLERERYIKSRSEGTYRRYYPAEMRVPQGERPLKHTQGLIVDLIDETPGISQKEIASLLGLRASTINYHIEDLIARGLVRKERRGVEVRYYPTDPAGSL